MAKFFADEKTQLAHTKYLYAKTIDRRLAYECFYKTPFFITPIMLDVFCLPRGLWVISISPFYFFADEKFRIETDLLSHMTY